MKSFPNVFMLTLLVFKIVSLRFWPVRALSLWYVKTSCAAHELVRKARRTRKSLKVLMFSPFPTEFLCFFAADAQTAYSFGVLTSEGFLQAERPVQPERTAARHRSM